MYNTTTTHHRLTKTTKTNFWMKPKPSLTNNSHWKLTAQPMNILYNPFVVDEHVDYQKFQTVMHADWVSSVQPTPDCNT